MKQSGFLGFDGSLSNILLRLGGLAIIDVFAVYLIVMMAGDGLWPMALVITAITLLINAIFLSERLYPLRWMGQGLALMILMVIYPILFTIYISFTNYGDGHLLSKQQTIELLGRQSYTPEDATSYGWTAYQNGAGDYALLLEDGEGNQFFAPQGSALLPLADAGALGAVDDDGNPATIGDYRMSSLSSFALISALEPLVFGASPETVQVSTTRNASRQVQRFVFDEGQNALIDQQTETVYTADDVAGYFTNDEGQRIDPGYQVGVGTNNFERIYNSPALRGPLLRVFIWTFAFAALSVLLTFALGLAVAIMFNDDAIPARKLIRSLLIIPYTIPAVISVLVWRGLLNPRFGMFNEMLSSIGLSSPAWFTDATWAKVGILLVNLWLGYPYMMLVASGALQAIPSDIYEAAAVDGASEWQKFRTMTLPLLLVSMGPILISSFAFNLNNFNMIYLYNEGGPPILGTPTPAGHTDILISYTYRLAFGGGRGADYGFAAAITLIIFLIVATITFFNFRYTKALEEVSENV